MPDNIRHEIGNFNGFRLDHLVGDKAQLVPYKRRDFFKMMLVQGKSKVHYSGKVVEVQKQAFSFSNSTWSFQAKNLADSKSSFSLSKSCTLPPKIVKAQVYLNLY